MKNDVTIRASRYTKLLWDEWLLRPVDSRYNIGFLYEISGELDPERLKKALLFYVNQNPIVRSSFNEEKEILFQTFHDEIRDPIEYFDYSGKGQRELDILISKLCEHSFNLTKTPLLRFAIIRTTDTTHYLALRFHHIIIDGTSARRVPEEISNYYNIDSPDLRKIKLEPPGLNEYLELENNLLVERDLSEGLEYWSTLICNRNFYVDLPEKENIGDRSRFSAKSINFDLGEELTSMTLKSAREFDCTVFHMMSALWSIFLKKYSNQDLISLMYPVSMRPKHLADLDGYLVNSLPMVIDFSEKTTLASLVKQIKEQRERAKRYQHIPFDQIVRAYNKSTSVKYGERLNNYLNVTIVQSDEIFSTPLHLKDLSARSIPTQTLCNSELSLIYRKSEDSIQCQICYNDDYLESSVFDSSCKDFKFMLEKIFLSPGAEIDSLSFLSEQEYRQVVYDWNRTKAPFPGEKTIQALFEEQVEKTPDNLAVVFEDQRLTYRGLNDKANQLAHTIRSEYKELCGEEIKGDTLIGLYIERGIDMIVGILGILKSGAAYVPFDLADPEDRLKFKVNDCGCRMIITSSGSLEDLVFLAETDTLPISLDSYWNEIEKASKANPPPAGSSKDLAYVIYTSGSTGRPKGVMTEHYGVVNFIEYHRKNFLTSMQYNNVIQSISVNFDASWTEMALSLFNGSCMYIIKSIAHMSGAELADFIKKNKINIFISTPAVINNLPRQEIPGLECLISGGDAGDKSTMDYWCDKLRYYNAYGPTEATICTTYSRHDRSKSNRDIGKPLQNKKTYILDQRRNPVPKGVYGELYIGGEGLARGYLDRPELTAERFIDNPFVPEEEKDAGPASKIYKTGDLARWLPGGSIEFLERNDDQIKINGFRVELGEIESKLAVYPSIAHSVVTCRERSGNKYLIAYYVAGEKIDPDTLEVYLLKLLPYYMVPSYFIQLEELPLSVSGKIDRRALPDPDLRSAIEDYAAPCNDTQERLCKILQELLGLERVGIKDDFFKLGGDSILSIQLCSRLRDAGYSASVKDIFEKRTVEHLSRLIIESGSLRKIDAEQGILEGEFDLLPIQRWFFELPLPRRNHWNQSFLVKVPELDVKSLEEALQGLVSHHDALRLRFGNGSQRYDKEISIPLIKALDVRKLSKHGLDQVMTDWQSGFDIEKGPLWQPGYLQGYEDGSAMLYFALHHLIVDAVSWRILIEDIRKLYDGEALNPKTSSYRQWVATVRDYAGNHESETLFWKDEISGAEGFNESFTVIPDISSTEIRLEKEKTALLLNKSPSAYNTEVNDLLLTALAYALREVRGEALNMVMIEGHGRESISDTIDVSHTAGWFTTMYPARLEVKGSLRESIRNIKEHLREIPGKGIGFSAIKYYGKNSDLRNQAIPLVSFNYLGQLDSPQGYWQIVPEGSGASFHSDNRDPCIINITGMVTAGELHFTIHSRLSSRDSVTLSEALKSALEEITAHCAAKTAKGECEFTTADFAFVKVAPGHLDRLQRRYKIEEIFPAGSLQQGFVYHVLTNPGDDAYRVQLLMDYHNRLETEKYKASWKYAVKKYPIMRTCFNWDEDILQIICRDADFEFSCHDIGDKADKDAAVEAIRTSDRGAGFDLATPGLFRIHLIRHDDEHYTLLKSEHHSIADGWSYPLQLNYVHETYERLLKGEAPSPETDNSYIEAQKYIYRNRDRAKSFWNEQIKKVEKVNDISSLLSVSVDPCAIKEIKDSMEQGIEIAGENYLRLKETCSRAGVTINILTQFAWHKLLSLYCGDSATVVGTTISGRDIPIDGIEESVGLYINTLPLIIDWKEKKVKEQLKSIHKCITDMNEHSFMNVGLLQKGGERLFHTLFVFENYPSPREEDDKAGLLKVSLRGAVEKLDYPLSIAVREHDNRLFMKLKYGGEYLFPEYAEKIMAQLESIINQIPEKIETSHNEIAILSPKDYETVIHDWNKTFSEYPSDETIVELFEAQAERTPDNVALLFEDEKLTYKELNERANRLAHTIRRDYREYFGDQIKGDTLIGIYIERSLDMITGILGILKSGAAYVPFDRDDPEERLRYKINDCGCRMIVTSSKCISDLVFLTEMETLPLTIDQYGEEIEKNPETNPETNPEHINRSRDLAYVIYTSGSTGRPKGVMIEHYGVINLTESHKKSFNIGNESRILQFAPISFDASVSTLFCALLNGSGLYLCDEATRRDIGKLSEFIVNHKISMIDIPAKLFELLPEDLDLSHLNCIITAGEVCDKKTMDYWCDKVTLVNAYGPTEATVCTTFAIYSGNKSNHNIGKPVSNKKVYVLDSGLNPVPPGIPGELFIGGDGLARGYLNHPDITKERFLENPFLSKGDKSEARDCRIYKSEDIVRWLKDGALEYIGRNDDQVKIRGFRIELGEIEDKLSSHGSITHSAVKVYEREKNKYICAYYSANSKITEDELRDYLLTLLPDYMIPSYFVELDEFPVNTSGKIDRPSLPDPDFKGNKDSYVAPRNELEEQLCTIWQELLGMDKVGIDDDFFRIGGSSILAIRLVHRMSALLGKEVTVPELFEKRRISRFSFDKSSSEIEEGVEVEL